ncbi:MAG: Hsp33 family molecular chaperone HslO [Aquificaceae bacterium]|nr:Hsp33 family molecular chaperone HslO [Aquificaceae bacterium]MDW8236844.1 Hsp33 family molecular chaperone HslO [Aquificaceae bacterium]
MSIFKDLDNQTVLDLQEYFKERDYMLIAVPRWEPIRVYVVSAKNTLDYAVNIHNLTGAEAKSLKEGILAGLILTSRVKHASNQKILLKLESEYANLAVEADGKGHVRGFVSGDVDNDWKTITVMRELGLKSPYVSVVPWVGTNISEALEFYFQQSEQTRVFTWINQELSSAFMVEILASASDSSVDRIYKNSTNLPKTSLRPEDLAMSLLDGLSPRLIGLKEISYFCPCSEEIARASLLLLDKNQLEEVFSEGEAKVVCRFCNTTYRFDPSTLGDRANQEL